MTSWWVVVQPTVVASTLPNPYTHPCGWSSSNVQSCNSRPTKSIMDVTWLAAWHTGGSRIWIDSATFKVQFINITNFEKRAQPFSSILVFWIWVCSHWHVFWCSSSFSWRIFWFEYLLACQSLYLTYYLTPVWVGGWLSSAWPGWGPLHHLECLFLFHICLLYLLVWKLA